MDRGTWWAAVHGVAKSRTRLSDFTFTSHFHALEKEMAAHSRVLAWRIPGTGEPGGLASMGSHRVGHGCSGSAAAAAVVYHTCIHSPVTEHFGCFCILAIVNDVAMNLFKLVLCFIFGAHPEIELLCHMVTLILDF